MKLNIRKYQQIQQQLREKNVTLVAVSKMQSVADIMVLYENGHRDFGENYVQELVSKFEQLPKDIRWHYIGHLQTNKVKYIAPFVHLVHGVDSEKLLIEINKQAARNNRVIDCLLQVFISKDENKFGFDEAELKTLMDKASIPGHFRNVRIKGLMGMASNTEDNDLIETEFKHLNELFVQHGASHTESIDFETLSMGMSADYMIAVNAGSNMVRIGSLIFGSRR